MLHFTRCRKPSGLVETHPGPQGLYTVIHLSHTCPQLQFSVCQLLDTCTKAQLEAGKSVHLDMPPGLLGPGHPLQWRAAVITGQGGDKEAKQAPEQYPLLFKSLFMAGDSDGEIQRCSAGYSLSSFFSAMWVAFLTLLTNSCFPLMTIYLIQEATFL